MRNKLNNKSGFTLIEVIIVVIILGVLAGLALPRVVAQVNRSYSAEATNELGVIMRAIDACMQGQDTLAAATGCDTFPEIGVTQPTGIARFSYCNALASVAGAAITACGTAATPANAPGTFVTAIATPFTVQVTAHLLTNTVATPGVIFNPPSYINFIYNPLLGGVPAGNKTSIGIFAGTAWQ